MYLADCTAKRCEWDHLVQEFPTEGENERLGKTLEVLHVLVKHPDDYQELTGKDPDTAKATYREQIAAVERLL